MCSSYYVAYYQVTVDSVVESSLLSPTPAASDIAEKVATVTAPNGISYEVVVDVEISEMVRVSSLATLVLTRPIMTSQVEEAAEAVKQEMVTVMNTNIECKL